MPMYSYVCDDGHTSEHIVKYDERELDQECSECGKPAHYNHSFCTNFTFGENYNSFHADRHRWNLRENKRLGTKGKNYD